jgi:hypothetical protein
MGSDRQRVSVRDRRGMRLAGGSLPRALAATRLPLHVRPRLHGRLSVLLDDRGRFQRVRGSPRQSRRDAVGGLARAVREVAGIQTENGLDLSWASSLDSDFNIDFNVWFSEEQQREGGIDYNYRREAVRPVAERPSRSTPNGPAAFAAMCGTDVATYMRERPGMSAFALEDGVVYHTYSTYARGLDGLWGMYQWLDRSSNGRNETGVWWRRHDEYDKR